MFVTDVVKPLSELHKRVFDVNTLQSHYVNTLQSHHVNTLQSHHVNTLHITISSREHITHYNLITWIHYNLITWTNYTLQSHHVNTLHITISSRETNWSGTWYIINIYCLLFCMGVKLSRWHWGRNVGWGCLIMGCWGEYLGLRGTRWQGSGEKLHNEELNDLY
jgi:hypothetical protein